MQVVLEEARASYRSEIIHAVESNTIDQMEENVERVQEWVKSWTPGSTSSGEWKRTETR